MEQTGQSYLGGKSLLFHSFLFQQCQKGIWRPLYQFFWILISTCLLLLLRGESSGSTLNKYGYHLLRLYYSLGILYILPQILINITLRFYSFLMDEGTEAQRGNGQAMNRCLILGVQDFRASQALVVKNSPANVGDVRNAGLTPGSGRSPGGGLGNLLQYSLRACVCVCVCACVCDICVCILSFIEV